MPYYVFLCVTLLYINEISEADSAIFDKIRL